jgi:MFS family permease
MARSAPTRIGVYLAVVQFVFTLTWTVYVIYLPKLAAQAGIAKEWVVYILLLDQVVFVVMDYAMGLAADRVSRVLGKLGYFILSVTLVSCAAFLVLPYAAPEGAAWLFLLITMLWAVSSSALRAPPLVLVGKYAAQPAVPWLSALSLFGLGLASAISPYLTITLRDVDPRLPFVISSIALALATAGIIWAERNLASQAPPPPAADTLKKPVQAVVWFFLAVLLLGLGFQIHFSLNSAPLYLRHAKPEQLQYLMPVFWIGFNVFMLPASLATKRYGGIAVASAGAVIAALASLAAPAAPGLDTLIALQFIAGGGWGCVLMSVVSAAIAVGHTGREGKLTGGLFSLLALAAFARIAVLAAEFNKDPQLAALFTWLPVAAWGAGGLILIYLVATYRRTLEPAAA